ncbi:hypothetical protein GCM10020367_65940 [Streptomyces sannanensis]|uniref:Uncharacterized protein n=1 Tax=Streptomyces sannanensis TaxID=285536 RepID=A0ABP6SLJ2_9ACTN
MLSLRLRPSAGLRDGKSRTPGAELKPPMARPPALRPDLARERGMGATSMARWPHSYSIPLRARGDGASHETALRTVGEAARTPRCESS